MSEKGEMEIAKALHRIADALEGKQAVLSGASLAGPPPKYYDASDPGYYTPRKAAGDA